MLFNTLDIKGNFQRAYCIGGTDNPTTFSDMALLELIRAHFFVNNLLRQDNLEVRIDELETMNKKLQRRRCDTVSTFSSLSLSRCSSFR